MIECFLVQEKDYRGNELGSAPKRRNVLWRPHFVSNVYLDVLESSVGWRNSKSLLRFGTGNAPFSFAIVAPSPVIGTRYISLLYLGTRNV